MPDKAPAKARGRDPRRDRRALQAARLHLPVLRDLRRGRLDLRLRPLRGTAQEQRQGRVVAGDAPGARRHRRDRLGDHPAPEGLGGLGAPRGLQRPPRPVPRQVQEALARGPRARGAARRRGRRGRDHLPGVRRRALGAAPVQPHVRDPHRPGRRRRERRLPAPRDGAGHLHQLQERPPVRPQEAALRDRPDRQVLPQRDHDRQLRLPHPRVRADGDGVLRAAGRGREVARDLAGGARCAGTPSSASAPTSCKLRPHGEDELSHYSSATSRHRVRVPDGLLGAGGDRQPRRLRPHPARQVLRREARVRRPATATATSPT